MIFYLKKTLNNFYRSCGLKDKASDFESGDCGFDSRHGFIK